MFASSVFMRCHLPGLIYFYVNLKKYLTGFAGEL